MAHYTLTFIFWAALSPWRARNGFVVVVWRGVAWVPASKLLMGICVAPEICICWTSDWCCCCTSWYRRAWCCSLKKRKQAYSRQSFKEMNHQTLEHQTLGAPENVPSPLPKFFSMLGWARKGEGEEKPGIKSPLNCEACGGVSQPCYLRTTAHWGKLNFF